MSKGIHEGIMAAAIHLADECGDEVLDEACAEYNVTLDSDARRVGRIVLARGVQLGAEAAIRMLGPSPDAKSSLN